MPLPSLLNGAKQCQVMTRRAKKQCRTLQPMGIVIVACTEHINHGMYCAGKTIRTIKIVKEQESQKMNIENHQSYC